MPLDIIMELVLLFGFNFILRIIFSISKSNDEYIHLWVIDRLANKGYSYQVNNAVHGDHLGYPSLAHYIISRFKRKNWILAGSILNAIYDCIAVLLIYVFGILLLHSGYLNGIDPDLNLPFYAALIFGTSPILFPITARLKTFGGRTFGGLFSLLYYASMFLALQEPLSIFSVMTALFAFIIIISSVFTTQSIVIITVFISACYLSIIPIVLMLAGFLIGMLFPVFNVKQLVTFKFKHMDWYKRNKAGTKANDRNILKEYFLLPVYLFTKPKKSLNLIFNKLTLVIAIYSIPVLVLVSFFFIIRQEVFIEYLTDPLLKFLIIVTGGGVFAFGLISLKRFSHWGQAERYLEYIAPTVSLLLLILIGYYQLSQIWLLPLVLIQITTILVLYLFIQQNEFRKNIKLHDRTSKEVLSWINNARVDTKILTIPLKNSYSLSCLAANENVKYYYNFLCSKDEGMEYMERDSIVYNTPVKDLSHFNKIYGINTLIVEKKWTHDGIYNGVEYDLKSLEVLLEADDYIIYRLG